MSRHNYLKITLIVLHKITCSKVYIYDLYSTTSRHYMDLQTFFKTTLLKVCRTWLSDVIMESHALRSVISVLFTVSKSVYKHWRDADFH